MKLLLGDAKDYTAIKSLPTANLAPAVLVPRTLHRKALETKRGPLFDHQINNRSN